MIRPNLPGRAEEPSFAEPWQAKAFATAVALSRAGLFTWPEWAAALGAEVARHPQCSDENDESAYFRQWLAALEGLLAARGVATADDIGETAEHWRRSYLHTPHGAAVLLRRDLSDDANDEHADEHEHHRSAGRRPAAVSPPG